MFGVRGVVVRGQGFATSATASVCFKGSRFRVQGLGLGAWGRVTTWATVVLSYWVMVTRILFSSPTIVTPFSDMRDLKGIKRWRFKVGGGG